MAVASLATGDQVVSVDVHAVVVDVVDLDGGCSSAMGSVLTEWGLGQYGLADSVPVWRIAAALGALLRLVLCAAASENKGVAAWIGADAGGGDGHYGFIR